MKNKITCIAFFLALFSLSALAIFYPKSDFSESERRVLAAPPVISAESIFSGNFASVFEEYSTDTFPFRDAFRSMKAYASEYAFNFSDNNGLFMQKGHLAKVDYPINEHMLDHAASRFKFVYDTHIKGKNANVYLSLVPDKNFFLDTLKYDYAAFAKDFSARLPEFSYIDITGSLNSSCYYKTDSHWKQETLEKTVEDILYGMGDKYVDFPEFRENILDRPFYGVYYGQSALFATPPDEIRYLTSDIIDACRVLRANDNTGMMEESYMYDMEKAQGRDAYELFLSGNSAVITIESPKSQTERELIIFRDSFGSSIAPLLTHAYRKITLLDLRYINPASLSFYANFENADVLFLYSTSLINSSLAIK